MNYATDIGGDLFNPPLLHGCLQCGAYVQPAADASIPAYCDTCAAPPEPAPVVKLYNRADGPAHSNIAPPTAPESTWERLIRLGDQAVDGNGVQVRCLAADWRSFEVTSQRGVTTYRVTIADSKTTCVDLRTGWPCRGAADGRGCAHIGAAYRYLLAHAAACAPVVYAPSRPVLAYPAALDDVFAAKAEKRVA